MADVCAKKLLHDWHDVLLQAVTRYIVEARSTDPSFQASATLHNININLQLGQAGFCVQQTNTASSVDFG